MLRHFGPITPTSPTHLALDLLGVEQVDEHLEAADVADRELTRLLLQVEVAHRAQRDHRRCLVPALQTIDVPLEGTVTYCGFCVVLSMNEGQV